MFDSILPAMDIVSIVFMVLAFIASLAVACTLFILYGSRNFNFWKNRGISGPKPIIFLGNTCDQFTSSLALVDVHNFKKFGKVYGGFDGNKQILYISDPLIYKKYFVRDFHNFTDRFEAPLNSTLANSLFFLPGEKWKRVRTIVSPTFTTHKLRNSISITKGCIKGVKKNLASASVKGDPVDCKKLFGAYTLDVIAKAAFATDIDTHANPNNEFARNMEAFFKVSYWRLILIMTFPSVASYFDVTFTGPESFKFFEKVINEIITERKKHPVDYKDLLQLLIDAEYDETAECEDNLLKGNSIKEKKLSEFEIYCQAFIFLLGGYETTAALLTHVTYSLAVHPDVQEKLYQEVMATLPDSDINYDDLQKLPFLDAVINETLRLYAPLYRLDRTAQADYFDEDLGLKIPKDTVFRVPVHAVHRNPEYFTDPDTFNPERFLTPNKESIAPFSFIPFGAGPRNCIGMRFALLEAKLALTEIIRSFRVVKVPETNVPLQIETGTALFSAKSVVVGVTKRPN